MTKKNFSSLQRKTDETDGNGHARHEFVLRYRDDSENVFSDHDIDVSRYSDGAVSLSTNYAEDFIYIYADQIRHLKKILSLRPPSKFKGTKKSVE